MLASHERCVTWWGGVPGYFRVRLSRRLSLVLYPTRCFCCDNWVLFAALLTCLGQGRMGSPSPRLILCRMLSVCCTGPSGSMCGRRPDCAIPSFSILMAHLAWSLSDGWPIIRASPLCDDRNSRERSGASLACFCQAVFMLTGVRVVCW